MEILVKQLLDFMFRIEAFATYHIIREYSPVTVVLYCAPRHFEAFCHFLVIKETDTSQYRMMAVSDYADGFKCVLGLCTGCDNTSVRFGYDLIPHRRPYYN